MADAKFATAEFIKGLGLADTRGWDTIYALKVPVLNEALRNHFSKKGTDATVNIACEDGNISALVQDWQIVRGSGSESLKIAITFASGEATVNGRHDEIFNYNLAGASAIATVRLGFHVPVSTETDSGDAVTHELKVALSNEVAMHVTSGTLNPIEAYDGEAICLCH